MMRKSKDLKRDGIIYFVPHTHYDAIWVFTKEDYFYINIDLILRQVVKLLKTQKEYKFLVEQTYLLEELERRYPRLFNKIAKYIKDGRIEIADGEYLMADTMLPHGETLIRQILYGKRYVKEKFGTGVPVMWQADSFGLNAQLPQIYRKCAYKYLAFRRGCPEKKPSDFIWEGLDGTKIISHFMPLGYRAGMDLDRLDESYKELKEVSAVPCMFMPSGSGVTLPQPETVSAVKTWNRKHQVKMKIATPVEFFENLKRYAKRLPVRRGEMFSGKHSEVFPDVASTRIWLKQSLREYENKLLAFEKFAIMNLLLERYYPEELNDLWKKVLFLAFHDVVPGTGMDSGYDEARQHVGFLNTQLGYLAPRVLNSIVEYDKGKKHPGHFVVFNALSWEVSNWVEVDLSFDKGEVYEIGYLESGKEKTDVMVIRYSKYGDGSFKSALIGFVAKVPATGYRVYTIAKKNQKPKNQSPLKIKGNTIENRFFKLRFDLATGLIEVFKNGKRICGGNELLVEEEVGDLYYHKETLGTPIRTESGEGVKYGCFKIENFWIDQSPLRIVINIETDYYSLRWPYRLTDKLKPLIWRHKYVQFKKEIIVYRDLPRIDFITRVDDKHPRIRLRVKFDTDIKNKEYTCETQFGAVKRETDLYHSQEQGWVEKPSGIFPSLSWFDYSDKEKGVIVINRGNPENEIRDGNIYLTLLRAVSMLSTDGMAGPAIPVPEAREFREYTFHYSVYPHEKDWKKAKSFKQGHAFNGGLAALQLSGENEYLRERSFLKAEPDNVVVSAVKKAEADDDLIVRLYEASGKTTRATLTLFRNPKQVKSVNMMEEKDKEFEKSLIVEDNKIKVRVGPFEIVTIKIKL
jgi:alpha-mannosidase